MLRCISQLWHFAAYRTQAPNRRDWTMSGQRSVPRLKSYAVFDPSATLAVHCGIGFDAGFSLYRSTRLTGVMELFFRILT